MEFRRLKDFEITLLIMATAAVVLHLGTAIGFKSCNSRANSEHVVAKLTLNSQHEKELQAREDELQKELKAEYGVTELDLIAYSSGGIREAIEGILRHQIPGDRREALTVSVDRFTGFRIYIRFSRMPERQELALWLKELFSRVDPKYVIEVVLTDGNDYRILEWWQLAEVNWATENLVEIVKKCFPAG